MDRTLLDRKLLFLQGPSSRFFLHLARACAGRGAEVMRVAVAPADRLFWDAKAGTCLPYRDRLEDFGGFLAALLSSEGVTDIVMLGDARPYHRIAVATARAHPGRPVPRIVEQGYLRPGLIAVEPWGHGGRSTIPDTFAAHRGAVADMPAAPRWPRSFARYAALDVAYHASNLALGRFTHPRYRHYALHTPVQEYAGWIRKGLELPRTRARARSALARVAAHRGQHFLFPLQLETDFQIRDHGTGTSHAETLAEVIASFARAAPRDALLIVKQHPLDNGLAGWRRRTVRAAMQSGVADRVVFLDGGRVEDLLPVCAGVVTVNSTVGLQAILAGVPCHALGRAIYGIDGLVHSGTLDAFWCDGAPPDPERAAAFARFLRRFYHVPGSFDGPGAPAGAAALSERFGQPFPEPA